MLISNRWYVKALACCLLPLVSLASRDIPAVDACWKLAATNAPCVLPRQEGVVCIPPSPYGSTVAKGWAQDPREGAVPHDCRPPRHCLYACAPGYWPAYFDQSAPAGYSYDVDTSPFGVHCTEHGLVLDKGPLCRKIDDTELVAVAINDLDHPVWLCTTTYPGPEMPLIPTELPPRSETVMSVTPSWAWHGPVHKYAPPQIYVSLPGVTQNHACAWNEMTMDGVSHLPWQMMALVYPPESGSGAFADFSVFPNKFFTGQWASVGYTLSVSCTSTSDSCFPTTFFSNDTTDYIQFVRTLAPRRVEFRFREGAWIPSRDIRFPSLPSSITSNQYWLV